MVQKSGMSRGPYPSSQEIPMEVFDPSPQVRRGARLEGKDRSCGPWSLLGKPREGKGYMPCVDGRGVSARPPFSRVTDRWTIGPSRAAVLRSGEEAGGMPVNLASRSPPRPGPCCWGTGSRRLTAGMLMGVGGNPGLEKRSWREAGERIRRGGRRRARLGALVGVGGAGVVLGKGRDDGQRALPTGLRRLRHWLLKVEKGSAVGGPPRVTRFPSLSWMFPYSQHPH